jgi:hypothetical protein
LVGNAAFDEVDIIPRLFIKIALNWDG